MINLHNVTKCRAVTNKKNGWTTLLVTYSEPMHPDREVIEAVASETGIESYNIETVLRCLRDMKGFKQEVEITLFHNDDFSLEIASE